MKNIQRDSLTLDDQVDYDLLEAHVKTRIFELETIRMHEIFPNIYYRLRRTNILFLRHGALPDSAVREALKELRQLPEIFANGKENLKSPARVWTENAIYQAYFAKMLLKEYVPQAFVDDPLLKQEFVAEAEKAYEAVVDYESWLRDELLPRSTRPPVWKKEEIEFYLHVHEQLDHYDMEKMLSIAEEEEKKVMEEMNELAGRIHPSGDLQKVWAVMKEEAPPWEEVLPMAQRYVDWTTRWLMGPGKYLVDLPENLDYGAILNSPMARRSLSFGGANYGPTVAGRLSGYYVLTPLEDRLSAEEKASRIKAYNPYWTHSISIHEWLGHIVQRAYAINHVTRPMRKNFRGIYFSQAWCFYLEKLFEDEGYYKTLPHMEELKTQMARRQMRIWRVQRIITKIKMTQGEMTFDEAVDAYVEKIGMERGNAFIEVQRDTQNLILSGHEILGEREILKIKDEYKRRMGVHYKLKNFHTSLLRHGDLPFKQLRRLIFRD
jgi:uncharacterized protein (DUF885 family)